MAGGLLHHGLERAAQRRPDDDALLAGDSRLSFAALDRRANCFAHHLGAAGVGARDRVGVMMSNRPEFVVTIHSLSKLGATAVLLNPAWKALEVGHAAELTGLTHGVADGPAVGLLADRLGEGKVTDLEDRAARAAVTGESSEHPADPGTRRDDDALLVFSSGTTGLAKAVRHTHRSFAHAVSDWRLALDLGPGDRFQVATPPSHILGLLNLVTAIEVGASVRLHPRFDLDEVLRRIELEGMTLEMAVAPIALALANHPDLESYDLSSLRYIMWGATPVTPSVAETVTRRTGVRWLPAYGASELPVLAANPVGDPQAWRLDSAGLAAHGVRLRVADLDTGAVLPPGGTGEIQALSPSVMAGYLPDEANGAAFVDGWYRTGDVGWMEPDGWLHLTDRSKEMIKVNGFQVAPAELETVLLGHPEVVDCAVFAVDGGVSGERPVAAVQLAPGADVTPEQLKALISESLATYKKLHHVVVVEAVPRLPSGKVLRRTLREEWEPRLTP